MTQLRTGMPGRSPRGRGKRGWMACAESGIRSIPAWAGEAGRRGR